MDHNPNCLDGIEAGETLERKFPCYQGVELNVVRVQQDESWRGVQEEGEERVGDGDGDDGVEQAKDEADGEADGEVVGELWRESVNKRGDRRCGRDVPSPAG